jgi:YVTN family beta-propeller protein
LRFDARTGARQARVPIPALANSSVTNALAVGAGSVWVGLTDANTVWRIDLRTNQLIATIVVGDHPSGIALSPGAVWVASADGTVSRIDPSAAQGLGRVVQTIRTGGTPSGITFGDGVVWVTID